MPLLPQLLRPQLLQAWRFAESDHCRHAHAVETFFVLRGRVCFQVDGTTIEARTGDSVVVPEGGLHDFENPSPDRVYLLTIVSSDHGFADRLRHGIPTPLDAEDLAVLRSLRIAGRCPMVQTQGCAAEEGTNRDRGTCPSIAYNQATVVSSAT
jgi:uncharacterized protein YjlB